jgi:uncharacterized protein (DUF433 family)
MASLTRSSNAINDIRDQPAYPLTEAARYLKVPTATLRSWVIGRPYPRADGTGRSQPLIHPPSRKPPVLSFWNLIEAHVLRSLRIDHGVSLPKVRQAIHFAEKSLSIEHLLRDEQLCTDAGQVFLERYGQLINLSASGQLAMRKLFEAHLTRVEWDEWKFPVRLFPFISSENDTPARPIAIDPHIAFGRPVVRSQGISTGAIADRIDAGESVAELAADYKLSEAEVEQAVLYERAA